MEEVKQGKGNTTVDTLEREAAQSARNQSLAEEGLREADAELQKQSQSMTRMSRGGLQMVARDERAAKERAHKTEAQELNAKNNQTVMVMQQKNAEQKVKKVQRAYVLALKLKAERLGAAAQQATVRSNRRAQDERDHKFIVEARHVRWKVTFAR